MVRKIIYEYHGASQARRRGRPPLNDNDGASVSPAAHHRAICGTAHARVCAMRFATIRTDQGTTAARLDGDVLVPLDAADVGEMLAGAGAERAREREDAPAVPVADADFAPVVT